MNWPIGGSFGTRKYLRTEPQRSRAESSWSEQALNIGVEAITLIDLSVRPERALHETLNQGGLTFSLAGGPPYLTGHKERTHYGIYSSEVATARAAFRESQRYGENGKVIVARGCSRK